MKIIEVERLSRRFGRISAVEELTFSAAEGQVFGVLGPNGAGKTTTVRLLNGILAPSGGNVRVLGYDPLTQGSELRQRTGVLTETPSLYERLTARENLAIFGALYGVPEAKLAARVDELLQLFDLTDRSVDRVGGFSKGMKQRLALARALIHDPPLLFLDEPTAGLDPESARHVTGLIETLSTRRGRTVFLCTHNLDEAQRLCNEVLVLKQGRQVAQGTLKELEQRLWRGQWVDLELLQPCPSGALSAVHAIRGVQEIRCDGLTLAARVDGEEKVPEVVATLAGQGALIRRVNPRRHSLEDIYFALQEREKETAQ
jgi:ABC-2 type transport system ATP-binding protein